MSLSGMTSRPMSGEDKHKQQQQQGQRQSTQQQQQQHYQLQHLQRSRLFSRYQR
jgi:hypothetical protein